jgi:hypothetical protein
MLKRIESVIFKVMAIYDVKEIDFNYEFYFLTRTCIKKVSYSFATKTS